MYQLPVFNRICNIWRNGGGPPAVPDVVSVCNLAVGRRSGTLLALTASSGNAFGGMWLLVPKGTDIRDGKAVTGEDLVEVPAGSGRFYDSLWVDDIGGGFPNEHRFAEIIARAPWPAPFPSVGPPNPPPPAPIPFFAPLAWPTSTSGYTFTASGSPIGVFVWVVDATGLIPILTSAVSGFLTGVVFTHLPPDANGLMGGIAYFEYTPPAGTETLTLNFQGYPSLGGWFIFYTLGSPRDNFQTNQQIGTTAPQVDFHNFGGSLENGIGAFLTTFLGTGVYTPSGGFNQDPTVPANIQSDGFGGSWAMNAFDGPSLGGGANICTLTPVGVTPPINSIATSVVWV